MSIAHLGLAGEQRQGDNRGGDNARVPPHDLLAEQSAIGGMLLSKDAVADVVEVVRGADFYIPKHEIIFDAILSLYSHGEPTDVIAVTDELTKAGEIQRAGGAEYLHTLTGLVPTAANAGFYALIVTEKAVLRRLVEAGTRIVQMGYASEGEVVDLVNNAQAEIYAVNGGVETEDYVPLSDAVTAAVDEIEAAKGRDGQMIGVPTGFAQLDALTNGLHPGQLIILAARPAIGKSTLALDFARAAAIHHDLPVVVFSLEMGRSEIAMRLLSAEASVPLRMDCSGTEASADSRRMAISLRPISREKTTTGRSWWIAAARAKSSASVDLPMAGRAARMIIWPGCRPLVRASSWAKPVGTPIICPSRPFAASISSTAAVTASESGT